LSESANKAQREVVIPDREGLHARPVMRFVVLACTFQSRVWVTNLSNRGKRLDGKSPMQMMLLEARQGSTLRIEASGADAAEAVSALAALIEAGAGSDLPSE
jgi:phosphotransferase system HPr (HPr) family protein